MGKMEGVKEDGGSERRMEGGRKKIRNQVSRSGFWPFMWDFMWESHPKLTKIGYFVQNMLSQNSNKSNT
jgi:hypothetical protein